MSGQTDEALDHFTRLWAGFDDPANTEAPHRQRTNMNKLLGFALFLGLPRKDDSGNKTPLGVMKAWQSRIGALRDLDVLQDWTKKFVEEAGAGAEAAANLLLEELRAEREALRIVIRREANGMPGAQVRIAAHEVRRTFAEAIARLDATPGRFNRKAALGAVAADWRVALDDLRTDQSDHKLHDFRIRNKRLRFVLEMLAPKDDRKTAAGKAAKVCREAHTALGDLHDLSVMATRLRLCRARWQERSLDLEKAADLLESGRTKLERETLRDWFEIWPKIAAPGFLDGLV